jgi:hypothetical protein
VLKEENLLQAIDLFTTTLLVRQGNTSLLNTKDGIEITLMVVVAFYKLHILS